MGQSRLRSPAPLPSVLSDQQPADRLQRHQDGDVDIAALVLLVHALLSQQIRCLLFTTAGAVRKGSTNGWITAACRGVEHSAVRFRCDSGGVPHVGHQHCHTDLRPSRNTVLLNLISIEEKGI